MKAAKRIMSQSTRNPHNLPTKICPVCKLSFTWRKKWERDWENVRYCSDRCRQAAKSHETNPPAVS